MFSDKFPLGVFIQQCIDIFGDKFNATYLNNAVANTNARYGALDSNATNVLHVHGSMDPWHVLGITEEKENGPPVIFINGNNNTKN